MTPYSVRTVPLQRAFTSFPSGPAGAALFLLRIAVGLAAVAECVVSVASQPAPLRYVLAIPAALAGLALLPGFMVPIVAALLAVEGAAILIFTPAGTLSMLGSSMALGEFVVMATVLAVLGPGAASVDARLFGRREVEID
jgi:hypothetical protein